MELDEDALQRVLDWAGKRVAAHERRLQMAPLMEAMSKDIDAMMTQFVPALMAGPSARTRESGLRLERSLAEYPERARVADEKRQEQLKAARRRTAALRRWLEELP